MLCLCRVSLVLLATFLFVAPSQAGMYAPGTPISDDFVLGPTTPGKWGPAAFGTGATVTWSLMGSGIALDTSPSVAAAAFLPAGFLPQINAAFAQWSAVANLTFIQVVDGGGPFNTDPVADIRFAGEPLDGPSNTLAHGFFPPANGNTAAGDIHFDTAELWKIGFGGGGFDIQQVLAHEIGHAIGLGHTAVPASLMNPSYTEAIAGIQADDIAGAIFIYGAAIVPEPSGFVLAGISSLFILGLRFRRKKRTA